MSGLAAGSYKVGFQSCGGGNYLSQFYDGKSSLATADAVSVSAGSTTSGIDAALQQGGQITGTVTDALTHAGIANKCVAAYDASNNFVASGFTDSAGHYAMAGLVAGSYRVGFQTCGGGNYAPQFYDGKSSLAAADLVSVTGGGTTSGIDAALQPGGQITGTVTDAANHTAISGACVGVYDTADNLLSYTQTNGAGAYTLAGLATGSYKGRIREWRDTVPDRTRELSDPAL